MEFEKLIDIRPIEKEEIKEAIMGVNQIDFKSKKPGMLQMLNYLTCSYVNYIGYTVITNKRKIICILNNDASCCECWDVEYKKEKTDLLRTPGAVITLNVDDVEGDYYEGSAVELEIIDGKVKHTIKLWNEHNGYYAHDYFIYDTTGELSTSGLI